jgi:tetratricopeptide (TPR) repeat protein
LGELFPGIGVRPETSGLAPLAQAELLLRVGTLCGWLGGANQVDRAQEIAKDLISESRTHFEELDLPERVADASNDLAICYWREGGYDEARAILRHVLESLDGRPTETTFRTLLNLAVVERSSMRWRDALVVNRQAATVFEQCENHSLRGKFHNEYATVLKNLGLAERREDYIDQALVEFAAASFHFELAGNKRAEAAIENNQGFLFSSIGRFREAHEHLNRARSLFASTNDRGQIAQVDETCARVLLAEGKVAEAESTARASVRVLQAGDQRSLLAESLTTHGVALARLERREEAHSTFKRAVEVAEQGGDPETAGNAALCMVEELDTYLGIEARQFYVRAEELLERSQDGRIKDRLGECARRILSRETYTGPDLPIFQQAPEALSALTEEIDLDSGLSLEERTLRFEGQIIKRALEAAGGSVTRAARLLGVTHQGLAFILNGRHKNLLAVRTPVKPRRRSIIRYR